MKKKAAKKAVVKKAIKKKAVLVKPDQKLKPFSKKK